jgi:hypothetical protein
MPQATDSKPSPGKPVSDLSSAVQLRAWQARSGAASRSPNHFPPKRQRSVVRRTGTSRPWNRSLRPPKQTKARHPVDSSVFIPRIETLPMEARSAPGKPVVVLPSVEPEAFSRRSRRRRPWEESRVREVGICCQQAGIVSVVHEARYRLPKELVPSPAGTRPFPLDNMTSASKLASDLSSAEPGACPRRSQRHGPKARAVLPKDPRAHRLDSGFSPVGLGAPRPPKRIRSRRPWSSFNSRWTRSHSPAEAGSCSSSRIRACHPHPSQKPKAGKPAEGFRVRRT